MKYGSGIAFLLFLVSQHTEAQIRRVVISTETGIPVRDVVVTTDRGERTVSNWEGAFVLNDTAFHEMSLGNTHYERRTMYREELTDTIELIPNINSLGEVVVIGRARGQAFSQRFSADKSELKALDRASPNSGTLSPGELLRKKRKKKLEQLERILKNY
jgi:hypothetical protein